MGKIITITGRSAVGKSTIEKYLEKMGYTRIISNTTRPIRDGETKDIDYHYLTKDEFEQLSQDKQFLESTIYRNWRYGIAKKDIEELKNKNLIAVIEPIGFKQIKDYLGEDRIIPILIYTKPYTRLKRALEREPQANFDTCKEICRRFISDEELFSEFEKNCPYKINNTNSYESAQIIHRIIRTVCNGDEN